MNATSDPSARQAPGRWPLLLLLGLLPAAGLTAAGVYVRTSRPLAAVRLRVETDPPGCGVRLDGSFVGVSPLCVEEVAPGDHFVEAHHDGYQTRTVRTGVTAGPEQEVRVELPPLSLGRLEVRSDPPGATVVLDGEDRGNTPLTLTDVHPGEHRVLLRRARYETWSGAVRVLPGQTAGVEAEMEDSFLKYLEGAIAADPKNLLRRGEHFHYLMGIKDWEGAAGSLFEAAWLTAAGTAPPEQEKGGAWYWLGRDAALLVEDRKEVFARTFGARLAAKAGEDGRLAARTLRLLAAQAKTRSRWLRNPELLRKICFTAAATAAAHRPVVEAGLDLAGELRRGAEVGRLLDAAARARPGDSEHIGWLAIRVVGLVAREDIGGSFRTEALGAASTAIQRCLEKEREDAALRARLRRVLARIQALEGRAAEALKELDRAIAELASSGGDQAARLASWRLERALLLVELGRAAEARKLLQDLASGAPDAEIRKRAAAELRKLPAPKPVP
jgi:hypothetical protein